MAEILLVEDSRDDVELTLRAFRRQGASREVCVAQDGEEALEYLFGEGRYLDRQPSVLPSVVLLDLNLPKLNGVQVLQRIRGDRRTSLLPVVMLTTSAEPTDLMACYNFGANSYVRKPVDYGEFVEVVRKLGHYWLNVNHRASSS